MKFIMNLGLSEDLLVGYLVEPEHKENVSWGSGKIPAF